MGFRSGRSVVLHSRDGVGETSFTSGTAASFASTAMFSVFRMVGVMGVCISCIGQKLEAHTSFFPFLRRVVGNSESGNGACESEISECKDRKSFARACVVSRSWVFSSSFSGLFLEATKYSNEKKILIISFCKI